jgi:threonine dehydratase
MQIKIIGVEPSDANAMALSLYHGQRVLLEHVGGFADGVAVKVVGEETFRLCRELIDGVVLVSRDAICASIKVRLNSVSLFPERNCVKATPLEEIMRLILYCLENLKAVPSFIMF